MSECVELSYKTLLHKVSVLELKKSKCHRLAKKTAGLTHPYLSFIAPNGAANPDTEGQSFITAFSVTSTGDIFQHAISRHAM